MKTKAIEIGANFTQKDAQMDSPDYFHKGDKCQVLAVIVKNNTVENVEIRSYNQNTERFWLFGDPNIYPTYSWFSNGKPKQ